MAKFIQGAIKRPGALHKYAQEHGTLTKKGTIDLSATKAKIERMPKGADRTRRLREVNLASTLRRLRA